LFNRFILLEIPGFQGNNGHDVLQMHGFPTPDAKIPELEF
jgi:hypothetical protein